MHWSAESPPLNACMTPAWLQLYNYALNLTMHVKSIELLANPALKQIMCYVI